MLAIFKRELASFFSSITGALVVTVFLLLTGLFLWVIPNDLNIIYNGYATLESLFYIAPWVYLFLVPAVTMRLFADEKRLGTLDLLLTRPVSELQIVFGKFLAGLSVVLLSLIPTLIYVYSVYQLGNPVGNMDMGGTWGSYIGLVFLAAVYVAIGVFASSLTDNQIVAFILAVLLCFMFYSGFDSLAALPSLSGLRDAITYIGIDSHYRSLSRGVIDSRDIVHLSSLVFFFLFLSKLSLLKNKR
ncbi:gliding motility-associated ABC transporter permease subunit GldF [Carboxylicivirga sp. A043]|uniref:gliding motility-associated ABC transporter permease subunit GldF n=1 Tax=Carboxylicivirga litoralis TaxID=2816963 RepID=UPI0021CB95B5|nr:gliding motility-associated ABC transporter permease subunit GldF [Carboxylicivirga sp. A043]MCU4156932.1 gliding motility-associated ABC transporter permease subunit GldF [Carboxylicivirga sp. A043]